MISKEDIKKLADLARIEIGEEEQEELAHEIDQILEYAGQVSKVSGATPLKVKGERGDMNLNVFREDENPTEPETSSKELIAEFPQKEKNYLKVKRIL